MADVGLGTANEVYNALERTTGIKITVKGAVIGSIQSIAVNQEREVTEHFTLGDDSEDPRALIPGIVKNKRITCEMFVIWKKSALQALGQNAVDAPGLKSQNTYFTIEETKKQVGTTETVTVNYVDCLVVSVSSTKDIGKGDMRVSERVEIKFRTIS